MSHDRSPALLIRFSPDTTAQARDSLVATLADYDLLAIQEDDVAAPHAWTAHFGDAAARDAAAAALRTLGLQVEPLEVEDEDWARRTQADLPAVRIGRLVVAPPWDLPDGADRGGDIVIVVEPSRGFGTGHHQSTRLCLVLLQGRQVAGRSVMDVGTGSGVLAIAAAKLGATFASAIDNDPDAVENARENIARNGVATVVEAHVRDLADPHLPPADLVVANLTGTLLARHAAALGALVRPSGSLIVAGFTSEERVLVSEAFRPAFEIAESAEEDGWLAYGLTRGPAPAGHDAGSPAPGPAGS